MPNRARTSAVVPGLAWILAGAACANNTISLLGDGTGGGSPDDDSGFGDDTWGSDGPGATSMLGGDDSSGPAPVAPFCGDGEIGPGEDCDGSELGSESCESQGAFGGDLECNDDCTFALESCNWEPPVCGNGLAERGEPCDGLDLGDSSCSDLPGASGSGLACTPDCELDVSECDVAPGVAVISEIFYSPLENPLLVPGQWLELHNPGGITVELAGCSIDGGSHFEVFDIDHLSIPPGGYVTLGTGTPGQLGMNPDFTIPPGFILMNDLDIIELRCGDELLDAVEYGIEEPWPVFVPGIGIAVRGEALKPWKNDDGDVWCASTTEYGLGQLGTPGAPNDCG